MATRDFRLPDLGEGLEEAEVTKWLVAEGDTVALNQPIAEVETAKAVVEIPSPFAGTVVTLHAAEGAVVAVGAPLVTFEVGKEDAGEAAPPAAGDEGGDGAGPKRQAVLVGYGVGVDEEPAAPAAPVGPKATERGRGRVRTTPPVRKLARELGVDLTAVRGTGPEGRITREDVEAAAEGTTDAQPAGRRAVTPREDERVSVHGVRRTMARHMARAAAEIPHVTTFVTVDCTWLLALRDELQAVAGEGTNVTPLAIVGRALAEVVREHPLLNASFDAEREEIVLRGAFNLGIATDTERGLLVPVVKVADGLGIVGLASEIASVVAAARAGTATVEQLTGSTITITNVGTFGAEFGTPIINHPESAILALGVIEPRVLVVEGSVVARSACTLSLSFDHRVLDGAQAGRAAAELRDLLQSPFRLGALPR
ncbi:MAG TPA: dihydrolipoamide acetyltransferase family protein [Actinomycetota bacterium]|nr:dihydrolipoamide acetyltransferase family protein [Actinomycetota bacterium]